MKKRIVVSTIVILFIIIIYVTFNFTLFNDGKPVEITRFDYGGTRNQIAISYVPSNATIQEQILLQKFHTNGRNEFLAAFERYQVLVSYQMAEDSLILVLADTSSYAKRTDTLKIRIANQIKP
ncbi:hypothetical protein [Dyadobacter sp. CY343]|uniref:hypothetical protein n=1 Tax=Dyadobacter sp. CY343 TaxID=2907299 RepID=UPI001F1F562C|nr:hypothetical protein [Dyadobacter sp. CY343]MCE7060688.1 hypothetical protein [Dyadobacter sp. CY343]